MSRSRDGARWSIPACNLRRNVVDGSSPYSITAGQPPEIVEAVSPCDFRDAGRIRSYVSPRAVELLPCAQMTVPARADTQADCGDRRKPWRVHGLDCDTGATSVTSGSDPFLSPRAKRCHFHTASIE